MWASLSAQSVMALGRTLLLRIIMVSECSASEVAGGFMAEFLPAPSLVVLGNCLGPPGICQLRMGGQAPGHTLLLVNVHCNESGSRSLGFCYITNPGP